MTSFKLAKIGNIMRCSVFHFQLRNEQKRNEDDDL